MHNLWDKINSDLVNRMKERKETELSTLRMLVSAIKYKKIALNKGTQAEPLSDEEIRDVIGGEIKKRKDSVEAYTAGNRPELAAKEKDEIAILEKYLPAQLTDEELETIAREVVAGMGEVTVKDTGRIIGVVMGRVHGQADGTRVSGMVRKIIAS